MLCPTGYSSRYAGRRSDDRCSVPLVTYHGEPIDADDRCSDPVVTHHTEPIDALFRFMGHCWCSVLLVSRYGTLLVLCAIGQSSWDAVGALCCWLIIMGN